MTPDELKAAFADLPSMDPVEPEHTWRFWVWDLRQNVANNDPTEFLTWPGLVGTMFVGNAPYIDYEYDELPLSFQNQIDDPQVGKPALYTQPGVKTSGNLIHHVRSSPAQHVAEGCASLPVGRVDLGAMSQE